MSLSPYKDDTIPPTILNCPSDIHTTLATGALSVNVSWIEPTAEDASQNVTLLFKTHTPGQSFGIGTTSVIYQFADASNKIAVCHFCVNVTGNLKTGNIFNYLRTYFTFYCNIKI